MKRWDAIVPLVVVAAIASAVFYFRSQEQVVAPPALLGAPAATGERTPACTELAGEPDARLDACLAQLHESALSDAALAMIDDVADDGKLVTVARLPKEWESTVGLEIARAPLMADDEAAAAQALRDAGVRGLVVSRDLRGALDDDKRVLARLAYHSHLQWFQLRYVTDDLFVYTVRTSPTRVPLTTGEGLLNGLRARLAGTPVAKQRWKPSTVRLMGSMRLQGDTLALRHAVGSNIEAVLDDLAAGLRTTWARDVVPAGHGTLEQRLDDIRIEVHVVMERAPVEPRSQFALFDLWQMGVDGMMFKQRAGKTPDKFTYMPGSELVAQSIRSPDAFLRHAVEQFGWHDMRPWEVDPRTQLSIIRTQHFMEATRGGEGGVVRLFRGMPEVGMADMSDAHIQEMLIAGGEWWLHNMDDDGVIEYKYWPTQNRRSTEYNEVRHILAARDLADTWRYRRDDRYLDGSRRAMDWLLRYAVEATDAPAPPLPHPPDGTMLFRYPSISEAARLRKPPNQKLGTVAVALLGWVAWAQASGSKAEDERIRRMARFVRAMMDDQGKYRAYYVQPGHPYEKEKNDIVPGEAALSLGMVAEYFDEPEWLDDHKKFIDYYRPWFRERAKQVRPTGRWPRHTYDDLTRLDLVQFGPWSVMANKQYFMMTGDEEAAAFGLEVADWMIDYYQWTGERSPWPDFVGGYYKLPIELPAMQTFCYSEGTAAAYQIAATYAPERKDKYDRSTLEAIRFMEVMQYDPTDSYFVALPDKVRGGIKYTMNENKVRIDYVGHGLSTLSQYLDAKRYDPAATLDVVDPAERATWGPFETPPEPADAEPAAE
ncbi:MAG: hypothetical protein ACI8PZ_000983 [Myxococcota bacterium]|jgi:hypothetical protein